jgi:hypothetical protein
VKLAAVAIFAGALLSGCRNDRNLLTISTPARVISFQVTDAEGNALWRIESGQARELSQIRYGEIPVGFEQRVPSAGSAPRPFRTGERLLIETVGDSRTFRHDGLATGPAAFRGQGWLSTPHLKPTPG